MLIFFYHIQGNVTVSVTYSPILASRPRRSRICPGAGLQVTLKVRHIVAYASPQFKLSLTHEVGLVVLILFYHIQGNVAVSLSNNPILASRPRSRRICPGGRLQFTLIVKQIVTYALPQLEISLTHQFSLIVLLCFYHVQGIVTVSVTNNSI